jgi:phage gpG-like protein
VSIESDLKAFNDKLQRALEELVSSKNLQQIGDFEAGLVKRRSRLGYGVPTDGGSKQKFKALAPATIASRKRKKLASETTPKKSNLTETGQLLNDLVAKIEGRSTIIGHTKDRNKRIGAFHQTGGGRLPQRRYLGLAKEDIKQITAQMQDIFTDILNKLFK